MSSNLADLVLRYMNHPDSLTDAELNELLGVVSRAGVRDIRGILQERGFNRARALNERDRLRLAHGDLEEVPIEV